MGLELHRDGTASISWQAEGKDHEVRLPMPTLDQLSKIMDHVDEVWDQLDDITKERNRIRRETTIAAGGDPDNPDADFDPDAEDLDALARLRKESRAVEQRGREIASSRFIETVRLLAPGPEAEVFAKHPPAWTHSLVGMNRLIMHFNTVPFDGPGRDSSGDPTGNSQPQPASND